MSYLIEYTNENEFRKLERSIKKYNMLAFKKLYFQYYPEMKEGKFKGKIKSIDNESNIIKYELDLPTDEMFVKIHGSLSLHYTVDNNRKIVTLNTITPENILLEGHRTELTTYKGVPVSKENRDKDIFKINLLNMLNKDNK